MRLSVNFRRAARTEFDDAADWYEERREGLGLAFSNAVKQVIDQAIMQPDFYPLAYRDMREALVPDYPYCVYFCEEPGRVVVLAIFHTARDPSVWQGRN